MAEDCPIGAKVAVPARVMQLASLQREVFVQVLTCLGPCWFAAIRMSFSYVTRMHTSDLVQCACLINHPEQSLSRLQGITLIEEADSFES